MIRPRRLLYRMRRRRHRCGSLRIVRRTFAQLGPNGTLLVIIGLLWVWSGWSTWNDLIGHPNDAPYLRIPGHVRSFGWWLSAAYAIWTAHLPRRRQRLATGLLTMMPTLRFSSYMVSWVVSWDIFDKLVPDDVIKGDPNAWGSAWLYLCLLLLILCAAWAPTSWGYSADDGTAAKGATRGPRRSVQR